MLSIVSRLLDGLQVDYYFLNIVEATDKLDAGLELMNTPRLLGREGFLKKLLHLLLTDGGTECDGVAFYHRIIQKRSVMRDTAYATELSNPGVVRWPGRDEEARMERLHVKDSNQIEIRFSWWKSGKMAPRPLDLEEDQLLLLFADAINKKVFSAKFLTGLKKLL
jgi:hypothetical protein